MKKREFVSSDRTRKGRQGYCSIYWVFYGWRLFFLYNILSTWWFICLRFIWNIISYDLVETNESNFVRNAALSRKTRIRSHFSENCMNFPGKNVGREKVLKGRKRGIYNKSAFMQKKSYESRENKKKTSELMV